jgi:hypothetical protein
MLMVWKLRIKVQNQCANRDDKQFCFRKAEHLAFDRPLYSDSLSRKVDSQQPKCPDPPLHTRARAPATDFMLLGLDALGSGGFGPVRAFVLDAWRRRLWLLL